MSIALKRGLNFIFNGKSYSNEEMFGLYRKTINSMLWIIGFLLFIGLPLGFKANAKPPEIMVIDASSLPKGAVIDSDSIIQECAANPQCVLNKFKAFGGYDNLTLDSSHP
jgi:hypothetical protein